MEQLIMEAILRHMKEKKDIKEQRGESNSPNIFCPDYSELFNMVSHKIFFDDLMKYGVHEHWYEFSQALASARSKLAAQLQHFATGLVELHEIHTGPSLKYIKVPVDGSPALQCVDCPIQLNVTSKHDKKKKEHDLRRTVTKREQQIRVYKEARGYQISRDKRNVSECAEKTVM
ncbi:hypothetical protein HGM15179_015632 [Zosterops borbonicus]|uniref:Uncharacterized protein n=1 Tax=Zosterops borbonicus TaxID=364589 RepID=A0A8K1LF25_9PASS|nr:hypothetical protein HGM15179_015632 [Zosterops borbonicus]